MKKAGISTAMGPAEWLNLLAFAALWGGSFIFTAYGVQQMSVLSFSFGRLLFSCFGLYAICRMAGFSLPRDIASWRDFFIQGGVNLVLPLLLIGWAQLELPAGYTAILIASTPFFTILAAQVLTRDEKISAGKIAGVIAGFIGVAAMIGLPMLAEAGGHLLAELAVLGGALFYALAGIFGRRFSARGTPLPVVAAGQGIAAAILLAPVILLVDKPWLRDMPDWVALTNLLAAAFFSNVLAPLCYFRLLATSGATNAMLTTFLAPVFAILLSALLLGETLQQRHMFGMVLIGIGLAAIDGRVWQTLRPRRAL